MSKRDSGKADRGTEDLGIWVMLNEPTQREGQSVEQQTRISDIKRT